MKTKGFTLIELVIVIVILGILAVTAAPRFLDTSLDAKASVVIATGTSFEAMIKLVNRKAIVLGGGPMNNLQLYGDQESEQLDINEWGFPAQNWRFDEDSPRLDNPEDCISVWDTVLEDAPSASRSSNVEDSEYQAVYISRDQCRFILNEIPELSIYYDSRDGTVTVDSDYSS